MRFARAAALPAFLILCIAAFPQAMTTIVATSLSVGGVPVNPGTLCFTATNSAGTPISVTSSTGTVYLAGWPFCQTITSGALSSTLSVPNSLTDTAAGHPYDVAIYPGKPTPGPGGVGVTAPSGTSTSQVATDLGLIYGVGGSSWSLNTYAPAVSTPVASPTVGYGSLPTSCTSPSIWVTPAGVINGCAAGVYVPLSSGPAGPPGTNGNILTDTVTGSFYQLEAINGALTMVPYTEPPVPTAPSITVQPTAWTGNAGTTLSFTAGAIGYPTPTDQWQTDTGTGGATWTNLSGATSNTYSATASTQNGYEFRAIYTNTSGSATTSPATATVIAVIPDSSGLIEFWKMNDTVSTMANVEDTGNPLTLHNGTWGTSGFASTEAVFNGTTTYAVAANNTNTNFTGSSAFSVCGWTNGNPNGSGTQELIGNMDAAVGVGWNITLVSDQIFVDLTNTPSTNTLHWQAGYPYSVGLHQFCMVYSSGAVTVYADGATPGQGGPGSTLTGSIANSNPVMVGAEKNGSGQTAFYDLIPPGVIKYVRIYNRALTTGDIATLYNSGVPQ
jgi:hypothetical protein